ncbi:transcription repressor OFP13 [Magnolia sinica]|uniref:transcription repressor OFP13 n=1 Tax=Magnolia sinica TaxID=86752 RepID=UPI00265AD9A8|nr:transcription repressor OFP13 [Magnolia sinica]
MGKKMRFPSLFRTKDTTSSWPWPSCKQPRTDSFRVARHENDDMIKTVNSIYLDAAATSESWFTNSSESASFSTASEGESVETVMRGVRSDRFFFEPGDTKSILEEGKMCGGPPPFEESVAMAMDSEDPYKDFRKSMEEMVEAHGVKEWEGLEELLKWYLKVNGKKMHGYIMGAFMDLMLGIVVASAFESGEESEITPL